MRVAAGSNNVSSLLQFSWAGQIPRGAASAASHELQLGLFCISPMGCSASLPIAPNPAARLVLYSQHAAAMDNFEAALDAVGTMKKRFDFEAATAAQLVATIEAVAAAHGQFERIAFVPLGPQRPPQLPTGDNEI